MERENKGFIGVIKYLIFEWGVPIIAAYLVFLLLNKFVFFNIIVPTSSMEPTIMPNDRIMVTVIYNKENIKRGDIIVFNSAELKEKLIKRVIGLPGDTIKINNDGSVFVNGTVLDEEYVRNQMNSMEVYPDMINRKFQVPQGCYLFLGDNRTNSKDSRYWIQPYINEKDILGKARIVIFPFKRIKGFQKITY